MKHNCEWTTNCMQLLAFTLCVLLLSFFLKLNRRWRKNLMRMGLIEIIWLHELLAKYSWSFDKQHFWLTEFFNCWHGLYDWVCAFKNWKKTSRLVRETWLYNLNGFDNLCHRLCMRGFFRSQRAVLKRLFSCPLLLFLLCFLCSYMVTMIAWSLKFVCGSV